MKYTVLVWTAATAAALFVIGGELGAHDPSSNPITWNREVSRIVYDRCASCHRPGGTSFSLMTFQDAQPRAVAIKEAVVSRRMPPWGAVKGFGHFRNDTSLTQEQVALVTEWVEGGITRGNNPRTLPPQPKFAPVRPFAAPKNAVAVSGTVTLARPLLLDGLLPTHVPVGAAFQITAARPDGSVEPLLWIYEYRDTFRHPFLFSKPVSLPAGTVVRGIPADASIMLIAASRQKR
jgi:hypothetical protein